MPRLLPFFRPASPLSSWVRLGVLCAAVLASGGAQALYKIVSPDGKVSYTDRPPVDAGSQSTVTPMNTPGGGGAASAPSSGTPLSSLPAELRQVATRYPVVLYTVPASCTACDQGRDMLKQRGIPFTERHVVTSEDSEALQKLTGGRDMPVMTVGNQVNRGYAPDTWKQYLDAAGYPAASRLPSTYQYSAPTPLTERKPAPTKVAPAPAPRPAAPPPAASTPGGLQF